MGSLTKEIPHSEVTATLEVLSTVGVTRRGLENVRTMSGALRKQIARIVEHNSIHIANLLSSFDIFDLTLGDHSLATLTEAISWNGKFTSEILELNLDLREIIPQLSCEKKRFIILSAEDLGLPYKGSLESLTNQLVLDGWSKGNLIGCRLVLCRPDAAPYILVADHKKADLKNLAVVIQEPIKDRLLTVWKSGSFLELGYVKIKSPYVGRMIFGLEATSDQAWNW